MSDIRPPYRVIGNSVWVRTFLPVYSPAVSIPPQIIQGWGLIQDGQVRAFFAEPATSTTGARP